MKRKRIVTTVLLIVCMACASVVHAECYIGCSINKEGGKEYTGEGCKFNQAGPEKDTPSGLKYIFGGTCKYIRHGGGDKHFEVPVSVIASYNPKTGEATEVFNVLVNLATPEPGKPITATFVHKCNKYVKPWPYDTQAACSYNKCSAGDCTNVMNFAKITLEDPSAFKEVPIVRTGKNRAVVGGYVNKTTAWATDTAQGGIEILQPKNNDHITYEQAITLSFTVKVPKSFYVQQPNKKMKIMWDGTPQHGLLWKPVTAEPGSEQLSFSTTFNGQDMTGTRHVRVCFEQTTTCSGQVPIFIASSIGKEESYGKKSEGLIMSDGDSSSAKDSQVAIAKAGVVDKPVTPAIPTKAVEVLSPAQGMVYPSQQDMEVRLRIDKNLFPTWNTSKWGFGFDKAGGSSLPEYATGGATQFVSEDHGQHVELVTMVPHAKVGKTESWQKPGSWHFEVTEIQSGSVNTVPTAASDFAFDQFDSFAATQIKGGPKFGSKVPQIAKGTGPAFGGGGPTLGGAVSEAGTGVPAVQVPPVDPETGAGAAPRGFGSRMPQPPAGGVGTRTAPPLATTDTPGLMVPGAASSTRTADAMADLEVIALSLDGNCNVWATLKNGGSAAIRETVKESIALDGRNVLSASAAFSLAPGQTLRRQVASYPRVKFAEAAVRYDAALDDANPENNSIEKSLSCPKEQRTDEVPTRTAPVPTAPGRIAPLVR